MAYEIQFPDPRHAEDDGLIAVGGEISVEFLLAAYAQGLFPWYNPGEPILWWSPNPRMILLPNEFKVSKSLKQTIGSGKFTVRMDQNFEEVMRRCAMTKRKGQRGTWISEEIIQGYSKLHKMGHAHSVESYFEGELVGGLYGISLGKAFFGESMFFTVRDASKVALYYLCKQLSGWEFDFIDVQQSTDHLRSMGAIDVPRNEFLEKLEIALKKEGIKSMWRLGE